MGRKCWRHSWLVSCFISRTEISSVSVKFQRGKIPTLFEKEKWERLTWELRAIRSNGDKIPLKHCWHAYCTQAWYVYSQIRQTLPTREATFLVLVYLHTQSSVKIMLRLWSDRRYERFGKCFLGFGEGGKTMKMFISKPIRDQKGGSGLTFLFYPSLFPSLSLSSLPSFSLFPSALSSPSSSPHHCLITTVEGSSPRYVEVWTWNRYRDFLASSWLDRVVWSSIRWRHQDTLLSMSFETSEAIGSTP